MPRRHASISHLPEDRSRERARQDYIKAIYQLGERKAARAADLARYLGVTRASVSKLKRMLERDGLLESAHRRMDALRLTRKGRALALRMVRRHRLVETFLHTKLHVPLERLHSEAERIEHAISDDVSVRLDKFLSYPDTDPHGHAIPGAARAKRAEIPLTQVRPYQPAMISSIDDRDQGIVAELRHLGVLPGCRIWVTLVSGDVWLRIGTREIRLSQAAAQAIRCSQTRHKAA